MTPIKVLDWRSDYALFNHPSGRNCGHFCIFCNFFKKSMVGKIAENPVIVSKFLSNEKLHPKTTFEGKLLIEIN